MKKGEYAVITEEVEPLAVSRLSGTENGYRALMDTFKYNVHSGNKKECQKIFKEKEKTKGVFACCLVKVEQVACGKRGW
jgi:hypothetical protein